jgi:hypothetical protein
VNCVTTEFQYSFFLSNQKQHTKTECFSQFVTRFSFDVELLKIEFISIILEDIASMAQKNVNIKELEETLHKEGFKNTFVWTDRGGVYYPEHTHPTVTAHIIIDGISLSIFVLMILDTI